MDNTGYFPDEKSEEIFKKDRPVIQMEPDLYIYYI